ncbi:MAG: hypothetical protein ACRBFS_27335 [Aureispira sp.]
MALVSAMVALFVLPSTCTGEAVNPDPIKQLITQNKAASQFTILLYDMEKTGVFSKEYKHRYRVLTQTNGRVVAKDSKWFPISRAYYNQHESNVGMELAAKDRMGSIKRVVGPPGYTNYIGDLDYGYWTEGINDTVVIQEKIVDTTSRITRLSYYDYPTKSTVKLTISDQTDWRRQTNKFSSKFVADTAYVKASLYRKLLSGAVDEKGNLEKKALAGLYYWKFYPHQAYISTLLQLPKGKIKFAEHQKAREQYRRGYSYYGIWIVGGTRRYGTYSSHTRSYSSGRRFSRGGGGNGK